MKLEFKLQFRPAPRAKESFDMCVEGCWEGELHVVRGPSGSGKSTLLKLFAGLLTPQAGTITLNDRHLLDTSSQVHVSAEARRIGMVFQESLLFPHLSVERNIFYGNQDREFARLLMHALEIDSIKHAKPGNISGGEQRRVAIARALATKPELLLLDEPFTGLNEELRHSLCGLLEVIQNEYEVGLIIVSHDYVELFDALDSSSIHFIDCGKLIED
ncbi:MAG: ATP-binding cassette domain-containing protein [Myxococcota bacterium]|nr:ATP-binding cassette domain-containing protein [Myxococcota bacterium]